MVNRVELEKIVDEFYPLDVLKKLHKTYLADFENEEISELDLNDISFSKQKEQKQVLTKHLTDIFVSEESFKKLLSSLGKEAADLFYFLTWEGGVHGSDYLEKHLDIKIITSKPKNSRRNKTQDIFNPFLIFCFNRKSNFNFTEYEYSFFLPREIRETLKKYFKTPKGYYLTPLESIDETEYFQIDDDNIVRNLPLYCKNVINGKVNFSKQGRVTKSSLRIVNEECEIKEFYPPENYTEKDIKDLEYLKTELIINFIKNVKIENLIEPLDLLKHILNKYMSLESYFYFDILLYHVKGRSNLVQNDEDKERVFKVQKSLFSILKEMPVNEWISTGNLCKYILYRGLFFEILDKKDAENLYFDQQSPNNYTNYQKTNITEDIYRDIVVNPFLKASMFLLSIFGVVDIAYDFPFNKLKQKERDYLSVFDGLKYVRFTELGEYIIGKRDFYNVEVKREKIDIKLDQEKLYLTVKGNDKLKMMFIENFAEKVTSNRYNVTYKKFLSDCNSKPDIEKKINLFKTEINAHPPKIWTDFFNDVLEKANPISIDDRFKVYKIKLDKKLISIIANDPEINKYLLKVENYFVAIDSEKLSIVKDRLSEYGYLVRA